ncbi:crossover junction endodeoxyribonuclease RuvC [Campylobacter jejuni]|nr:crossover junction endodeoxyribonuclease RuvC [Campylobacter jejuni]
MNLKILGIDPGSKNCGYAIIEGSKGKNILIEAGLIKIKPSTLQYQITELCEGLDLIFKNHSFDEVAIEDIFFAYNPKTVLKLAQFRGALSLKILQIHGDFAEYTPLQVKKAVTGKAKATKEQVAFMVKRLLGLSKDIKPLDITDAIAVALTHAANLRTRVEARLSPTENLANLCLRID